MPTKDTNRARVRSSHYTETDELRESGNEADPPKPSTVLSEVHGHHVAPRRQVHGHCFRCTSRPNPSPCEGVPRPRRIPQDSRIRGAVDSNPEGVIVTAGGLHLAFDVVGPGLMNGKNELSPIDRWPVDASGNAVRNINMISRATEVAKNLSGPGRQLNAVNSRCGRYVGSGTGRRRPGLVFRPAVCAPALPGPPS